MKENFFLSIDLFTFYFKHKNFEITIFVFKDSSILK